MIDQSNGNLIPHDVVTKMVDGASAIRAWREHLKLTQDEVAARLGISPPVYVQQEIVARPLRATRKKIAVALGIKLQQLEL